MKIMMVVVEGMGSPSWRRIVEVYDPIEFMGHMRARALKEVIKWIEDEPGFSSQEVVNNNNKLMKSLEGFKVRLKDTKVAEFPNTYEEYCEAYANVGVDVREKEEEVLA